MSIEDGGLLDTHSPEVDYESGGMSYFCESCQKCILYGVGMLGKGK